MIVDRYAVDVSPEPRKKSLSKINLYTNPHVQQNECKQL